MCCAACRAPSAVAADLPPAGHTGAPVRPGQARHHSHSQTVSRHSTTQTRRHRSGTGERSAASLATRDTPERAQRAVRTARSEHGRHVGWRRLQRGRVCRQTGWESQHGGRPTPAHREATESAARVASAGRQRANPCSSRRTTTGGCRQAHENHQRRLKRQIPFHSQNASMEDLHQCFRVNSPPPPDPILQR